MKKRILTSDVNTKHNGEGFSFLAYALFFIITLLTLLFCVCTGSVSIPLSKTVTIITDAIQTLFTASPLPTGTDASIVLSIRLPRVICVALTGASLSLCGCAMQGLLKNPLADGSTLGVSSGASLGAVLAIAFNITLPSLPFAATTVFAIIFAFASLVIILSLAYKLDYSLSTNTIILIGVIFSMFISSILSLIITFAPDKVRDIIFWTMGSLASSTYTNALVLLVSLGICSFFILFNARELNAFAIGEDNARHIGVNVKKVKLLIFVLVSVLIGVCVSIGGTIGFVGLVTHHMLRMIVGPNHKKLLPASMFGGAVFLMLADLLSRILLNPLQLPIGVITSFIGAILFIYIFYRSRRAEK